MGLYSFCKYRLGFMPQNMSALTRLRTRFEVAADNIHPEWRELLSVVGEQSSCVYRGQPCDWVVSRSSPPVPLADTYSQWDPHFSLKHLEESVIDEKTWDWMDPRAEKDNTQCTPFERGAAIGEFTGLITRELRDIDVMQSSGPAGTYQIFQGHQGNYTRFINHCCQPNSQYERFFWLGVQRIVLVSKGISAGEEISVDYSDEYWDHLDKKCLCSENSC
ncbi:hypothetical protein LTR47_011307 [Exophiala xenobiotica]|nr:hypothetical protein LTR72_011229 [Exophiala xenobiotica]KAK5220252.1 hypothetical protein LTR47_011307 [Exophiala xenobiotica]KAK5244424.1 hypothetical protein LTS06_010003 [Exophiala xenobiotica]KAK5282452.1 hypothetical protein LTR40_003297 [Exophiala xenobiotica]KAK5285227.1 hypothetical protein LTR14_011137 [Exophiala xenobiotica]